MIELDFIKTIPNNHTMQKTINTKAIKDALERNGMTQANLAEAVGVSSQAVTNWFKGVDFPRPATLLKLASTLSLTFSQMVDTSIVDAGQPVVAFRKKGNAKTTQEHILKATEIGFLLKPLVSYLPEIPALKTIITHPSFEYGKLQVIIEKIRTRLGISEDEILTYHHLIEELKNCGAVLVPVFLGEKKVHQNALHIRLPQEDVTFIFLNLDTRIEDFKFWMAHELAHVYTPALTGEDEGEDFADAFAGALLFPLHFTKLAYADIKKHIHQVVGILEKYAAQHSISINTVYQQVKSYAHSIGDFSLGEYEKSIHIHRSVKQIQLMSDELFNNTPILPSKYIEISEKKFKSEFFNALKNMVKNNHTGSSYIQQIMSMSVHDAIALYEELKN